MIRATHTCIAVQMLTPRRRSGGNASQNSR